MSEWKPISELVETVQEGFILVYPTEFGVPDVWARQTYFDALRRPHVPNMAVLSEMAQRVKWFQDIDLVSLPDDGKSPGDTP